MKILVTGGRTYEDRERLYSTLDQLAKLHDEVAPP